MILQMRGATVVHTLKGTFCQKYDKELMKQGFQCSKGKYPYYVRIVDDEILHILTFRNLNSGNSDYGLFTVLGGIATVYREKLNLCAPPNENIGWLNDLSVFCRAFEDDMNKRKLISEFAFAKGDDASLQNAVDFSYECTEKFLLPQLEKVSTLDACISWFRNYQLPLHLYDAQEMFGNNNPNNFYNEGLLFVKVRDLERIQIKFDERLRSIKRNIPRFYTQADYDLKMEKAEAVHQLDEYHSELFAEIENELKRRKTNNLMELKNIGLI